MSKRMKEYFKLRLGIPPNKSGYRRGRRRSQEGEKQSQHKIGVAVALQKEIIDSGSSPESNAERDPDVTNDNQRKDAASFEQGVQAKDKAKFLERGYFRRSAESAEHREGNRTQEGSQV